MIAIALLVAMQLARTDRRVPLFLLTWAIVPPVFCHVVYPIVPLTQARYVEFTVPAWLLLTAAAGFAISRSVHGAKSSLRFSAAALLLVPVVAALGLPGQTSAREQQSDAPRYRLAFEKLATLVDRGDGVVFIGRGKDGGNGREAFEYARSRDVVLPWLTFSKTTPNRALSSLSRRAQRASLA